jgi:outer membrane biogenesis lipoprotein LolB
MRPRSFALALILLAACSGSKPAKSTADGDSLTERQRDSILAQSRIPGASGVGRAMRAADSASARIRATDSVSP